MFITRISLPVFALAMMMTASAHAEQATTQKAPATATEATKSTDRQGNAKFQNDAYITISGTVAALDDKDEFELRHANGTIKVDTDDAFSELFKKDAATALKQGDRVVVTGKVDNNLFTANEIEAYRIEMVQNGKNRVLTNNKISAENKRDLAKFTPVAQGQELADEKNVRLSGRISQIDGDDSLQLRFGEGTIKVDLDDVKKEELANLKEGDTVVVFGEVDKNWMRSKEINAVRVVPSQSVSQAR